MLFKKRKIKINFVDCKMISGDFKNDVKMTSLPSLVRLS